MKKLIVFVLTVSMVLSLSLCAFAQTDDVKKDSAETWKEYLLELKDVLTETAQEKAKEDSDKEKLDELGKKYVDLLVKKVSFIKEVEKTSLPKAEKYKAEWNKAYKTYSEVTKYETAEWRTYLLEFRAAAEKYVIELEKETEDYTDRVAAANVFTDLLMQRRKYFDLVFDLHPQHARAFLDEWHEIFLIVAER